MEAARSGDASALAQLLAVCRTDVKRYARAHCRFSDLEDAVQAALLAFVQHLRLIRSPDALPAWLSTTVKRECHRLHHAQSRFVGESDGGLEERGTDVDSAAMRVDLLGAFESLPPHYLEIILLRDFEEKSIKEIADDLGERPSSIKSRLHRARALMREYLSTH